MCFRLLRTAKIYQYLQLCRFNCFKNLAMNDEMCRHYGTRNEHWIKLRVGFLRGCFGGWVYQRNPMGFGGICLGVLTPLCVV